MKKVKSYTANVLKIIFLLLLVLICFIYAMFQGGFVSWFLLGSFLPIAIYGLLLYFYPLKNIKVERILKQVEFNAGEKVEITISLSRKDRFPLFYLIVEDVVPAKLKRRTEQSFKFIVFPLFRKQLTYHYVIEKIPRGEYQFDQFKLATGDLLGFVNRKTYYEAEEKILVYPSFVDMAYEPYENQFEQGMTATKDKVQRDSTMAISIREYEPGDRFSWIHWKASARKNEIMTKEFEQRQTHDILLVLDRTPHDAFDLSVTFTASVIRAVLRKGAEVGLYSYGGRKDFFPVQRGEFQQRTLFYHLASVEDDARVPLNKIIEAEPMFLQQNRTIMFVVNELRPEYIQNLGSISNKKGHVLIFVIQPRNVRVSDKQIGLVELARQRGIIAKIIQEGEFSKAFGRGDW